MYKYKYYYEDITICDNCFKYAKYPEQWEKVNKIQICYSCGKYNNMYGHYRIKPGWKEQFCWGTASENAHDRKRHGTERARENGLLTGKKLRKQKHEPLIIKRGPRGEEHGSSKLSAVDVRQIRKWIADGAYTSDLAGLYGVSRTTIQRVANGSLWRHVA